MIGALPKTTCELSQLALVALPLILTGLVDVAYTSVGLKLMPPTKLHVIEPLGGDELAPAGEAKIPPHSSAANIAVPNVAVIRRIGRLPT